MRLREGDGVNGIRRSKADAEFSLQIRQRDGWTCQRCGARHRENSRGLHCAHMFTRRTKATRHDPDNAVALCYGCHSYVDANPWEKAILFRQILGDDAFDELAARARGRRDREGRVA